MSDLESICASLPVGEGRDSGDAYSSLATSLDWLKLVLTALKTYVPVFPDLAREFTISWDVPKSDSIALGLVHD